MPKIVDRDQYRRELLSKSLKLIAEKGYATITMRQIAEGLGVSTGTLYHYFPSKESLFEQLVEHISYQDTSESAIARLNNLPTLAERVEAIFELLAQNEEYFVHQMLMLIDFCRQRERQEINNSEVLKQAGTRYEIALYKVLGIDDPGLIQLFLCVTEGLIVRRLYQGDRIDFSNQAKLFRQMLTAYLNAQS
jgi:AcrR family transcriptional regulator